jgi:molybdate transport system regulatory protein
VYSVRFGRNLCATHWPANANTHQRLFPLQEHAMRLSARNTLPGIIRKIDLGAVNSEVTIELAPNLNVVAIITMDAVDSLKLKVGDRAYAVIKASSVMVAIDD